MASLESAQKEVKIFDQSFSQKPLISLFSKDSREYDTAIEYQENESYQSLKYLGKGHTKAVAKKRVYISIKIILEN